MFTSSTTDSEDAVSFVDRFRPRSETSAAWVLFVLTVVAAGATAIFTIAVPPERPVDSFVTLALCILITTLAACLVAMPRPPAALWAAYPFLAVLLIVVVDVITHDRSTTAQVFFVFPVLYAGAQLRKPAAIAVCAAAAVGDAVVVLSGSPTGRAYADVVFVGLALGASAAVLIVAGERNDRLIAQLERQAAIDPLTGLTTRRVLDAAMRSALEGAGDTSGTALILLDVDHFKAINDVHGHPAGDAVLQQLARILLANCRPDDLVSRLGGDEIALLLPACPLAKAAERAGDMLQAVRRHRFTVDNPATATSGADPALLKITLSIGVAHVPTSADDLRSLYSAADTALYEAKRNGRNQVVVEPTGSRPSAATNLGPAMAVTG